jgi:predicted phosphoribosyltransferase
MGGIPLASEVAKKLACPMDVVIVRKIQVPGNTESGFGAMTDKNWQDLSEKEIMPLLG